MLVENLKRNMAEQKQEFRVREEAQAKRYDGLEEALKKQLEDMATTLDDGDDEETSPTLDCTHFILFFNHFLCFLYLASDVCFFI